MTTALLTALVTLTGAVLTAAVTVLVQTRATLRQVEKDTQLLYLWNRQLVDHIWKQKPPPPPAPPAGLFTN